LKVSNITRIPSTLGTARKFMNAVNWNAATEEVKSELGHTVAIVGLPNSGKSTLFNTLRGTYLSPVSPEAGTTKTLIRGEFGPFTLIDTPGHLPDMQQSALDVSSVVVYLLDASEGIRRQDYSNITNLQRAEKSLVVALNKSDLLQSSADEAAAEAAARLHVSDVIPISAQHGENIAEELIPALIEANPEAALTIGRALPQFRRKAANKLVRNAAIISLAAGLEPVPLIDIPILIGTQVRMVLRVAAVYNEPLTASHARELVMTIAGGLAMRYIAEQAAKMVPFGGNLVSGAIAAAATWSMGQVAIEYFESDKKLNRSQINEMLSRFYRRFREEGIQQELEAESRAAATDAPTEAVP
jgi:small GTP-binding protein